MKHRGALAVVLLLGGTVWALSHLFSISTRGGAAYPAYSSLRSDPLGAKALHDSLAALPGYRVERSFKPRNRFRAPADSVILVLGSRPETRLQDWAEDGARVVVGFAPEERRVRSKTLEDSWKLEFKASRADRQWTAFRAKDDSWRVLREIHGEATIVEKTVKKGTVVFVGEGILLSNEGLHRNRDSNLLLALLGGRSHVIFEEGHLGVTQQGSIGELLRRYRLWGAGLVLLILAGLFIWRSTSSLVPRNESTPQATAAASGEEALVNLVRGAVPPSALASSALALWTRGGGMLKGVSEIRRQRVARVLQETGARPLEAWNQAHEILKRNHTS
jgi:hypothetical protein